MLLPKPNGVAVWLSLGSEAQATRDLVLSPPIFPRSIHDRKVRLSSSLWWRRNFRTGLILSDQTTGCNQNTTRVVLKYLKIKVDSGTTEIARKKPDTKQTARFRRRGERRTVACRVSVLPLATKAARTSSEVTVDRSAPRGKVSGFAKALGLPLSLSHGRLDDVC